jgi:hypothetical protein
MLRWTILPERTMIGELPWWQPIFRARIPMKTIAAYFGVHYSTVSRAIRNSGRREIKVVALSA